MSTDPWTVYWQGDHLESCIASTCSKDSQEISLFWRALASELEDGSTILDLASGNGAVPAILLSVNNTFNICAVDKARVEPRKYLSQAQQLASVNFIPETDICDLPFGSNSFDVVTSQFGLEYAPMALACQSAVRVLKSRGIIRLLMHHEESEILRPAAATIVEIERLFEDHSVMSGIESYLVKKIDSSELETIGQQYLQADGVRTRQVSGQIFAGINQIVLESKTNPAQASVLLTNMRNKLLAEQARLQQLQSAALNIEQAHKVEQIFTGSGINIEVFEALTIQHEEGEKILIGWKLIGIKN